MTEPKPLKNNQYAQRMGYPSKMIGFHIDKDITSAVKYLKLNLSRKCQFGMSITRMNEIVDKAFEDVVDVNNDK